MIKTLIAALIVAPVAIGGAASAHATNPTLNFAWGGVGFV